MPGFVELLLSTGVRLPARLFERWLSAETRKRRRRDDRIATPPLSYQTNNHLRSDIGLSPVDSKGWPL
jgi:hypothetical protein